MCHYNLTKIILKFINYYKFFNLETLNNKIQNHYFGPHSKNTNIVILPKEMLEKNKIKASASEMLNLYTHFSLIIGDLFDSSDTPEWSLYLKLREIMSIVFEKSVHIKKCEFLKILISEHHQIYISCFGNLKPKHHFMVHYPNILKQIGPLANISSMRFEAFHKTFKDTAKTTNCRKNLLHTLVVKNQFQVSEFLNTFESFFEKIIYSPLIEKDPMTLYNKYNYYYPVKRLFILKWVEYESIRYTADMVIQCDISADELSIFCLIKEIYLVDEKICFCCEKLYNLGFDSHFHGYVVENKTSNIICNIKEITSKKTSYIFYAKKKLFCGIKFEIFF